MIVYRLTTGEHINDLSGTGSKLYGGRWNSAGLSALYTTGYISLAVLENLVYLQKYKTPADYHLLTIELPDIRLPVVITKEKLKRTWKDDLNYSRFMGDEFLKSHQALYLKVPSAIVDQENNFIVNPDHSSAGKIKVISSQAFVFDKRLFLSHE